MPSICSLYIKRRHGFWEVIRFNPWNRYDSSLKFKFNSNLILDSMCAELSWAQQLNSLALLQSSKSRPDSDPMCPQNDVVNWTAFWTVERYNNQTRVVRSLHFPTPEPVIYLHAISSSQISHRPPCHQPLRWFPLNQKPKNQNRKIGHWLLQHCLQNTVSVDWRLPLLRHPQSRAMLHHTRRRRRQWKKKHNHHWQDTNLHLGNLLQVMVSMEQSGRQHPR